MQHTPKHLWIALWFVEGETNIDLKLIPSFLGTRCTKKLNKNSGMQEENYQFFGEFLKHYFFSIDVRQSFVIEQYAWSHFHNACV